MWVYDPQTLRFLAVNETAIANYGYTRDEFLAMTIDQIRPADDVPALRELVRDPERRRVEGGVWRHVKKDGGLIEVNILSNAIEFDGRPARLVLAEDVTEQRRLEEQLRQSQKMEAVGNLAGGIAHDFNNIMMVIRACTALLQRRAGDEEHHVGLREIDKAAERAVNLTCQLLAFSRRQVLQPEVVSPNKVIEEMLELLRRLIGEDIQIIVDLDPELSSIVVDPGQLGQVLLNLVANARDAMPQGGTLAIKTANATLNQAYAIAHPEVSPGPHVLVRVTDSGRGMDEETRAKVFDPFFTTKESGTGLGLATVYGIVKQSGGNISLYSEPEIGTTFRIYFPSTALPAKPVPRPTEVTSLEGEETVLLVEDEEALRSLVGEGLRAYGYTILEASDGAAALRIAEEHGHPIELLITDVVMPGMNGPELAERLVARYPTMRVLFTSGYPADTLRRQGIGDGVTAYIEKPYLPEELAHKLRQLLATKIVGQPVDAGYAAEFPEP